MVENWSKVGGKARRCLCNEPCENEETSKSVFLSLCNKLDFDNIVAVVTIGPIVAMVATVATAALVATVTLVSIIAFVALVSKVVSAVNFANAEIIAKIANIG